MAKARLYQINTEKLTDKFRQSVKGQCKIVLDTLLENNTPLFAEQLTEIVRKKDVLKTRQDLHRVVLYYIIVMKSKGFIHTYENETVEEETVKE